MGFTGLALVGFVIGHLAGNLTLYVPGGEVFNRYARGMESLGALLIAVEIGLVLVFLLHVITGIRVKLESKRARPVGYAVARSKGGPSKGSFASRNMILTGMALLAFVIIHVKQFKYGPGVAEGYVTTLDGAESRDLYRLVVETYQNPWVVAFYVGMMLLLGMHLRHGFWSAFQSLGVAHPRWSPLIYSAAALLAVVLAGGFLIIPIWLYFNHG